METNLLRERRTRRDTHSLRDTYTETLRDKYTKIHTHRDTHKTHTHILREKHTEINTERQRNTYTEKQMYPAKGMESLRE